MFVSVSSDCFHYLGLSLDAMLDKATDIGFTSLELVIGEDRLITHAMLSSPDDVAKTLRTSRRISAKSCFLHTDPTAPGYRDLFIQTCQLARATMVVTVIIRPSQGGTPFNDEVDRLRDLVELGKQYGTMIAITTEHDRITETPDAVVSLCKSVAGLGVSLDTSHYIFGYPKPKDYDDIMEFVYHLRLRDTTTKLFQIQVGQGKLEYGKLMIQLRKCAYQRAMCIDLSPLPNIDPLAEMRKMRLLLESLL